ncbi:hypothetical protein NDU88_010604 [Pleurodeles waltl]|uniref:Uncharacterized protein n=1 Tax=Pleurodeles waltl TaxID=8319 RepID=A0AAV7QZ92_PLEWA|nr:hypothetical protein NDU88_010604 [Pleurodeles waltl]
MESFRGVVVRSNSGEVERMFKTFQSVKDSASIGQQNQNITNAIGADGQQVTAEGCSSSLVAQACICLSHAVCGRWGTAQAQCPGRPRRPLFPSRLVLIPSPRSRPARTRLFSQREPPLTWRPLCLVVRSWPAQSQGRPRFFFFLGSSQLLKCSKHPPPVRPSESECYFPAAGRQVSALSFPVAPLRSLASKRCPRDRGPPRLAA